MSEYSINLNGNLVSLGRPIVMAIVNITPDSFYESCKSDREILQKVEKAVAEGAAILDVGGYSTRPDADVVPEEEEIRRISTAFAAIRKEFPQLFLSVDTFRARVAEIAVKDFGVAMVNDVSGGTLDDTMFETVGRLGVAYVLMHMQGNPQTMQQHTHYENLLAEIIGFFQQRVAALKQLGVKDIVLDPGFGFAKTLEQNYELLQKMSYLKALHLPVMAGVSRKSMIYRLLGGTPQEALNGTTVANTLALLNGADLLRVHDVKAAMEAIKVVCETRKYDVTTAI